KDKKKKSSFWDDPAPEPDPAEEPPAEEVDIWESSEKDKKKKSKGKTEDDAFWDTLESKGDLDPDEAEVVALTTNTKPAPADPFDFWGVSKKDKKKKKELLSLDDDPPPAVPDPPPPAPDPPGIDDDP